VVHLGYNNANINEAGLHRHCPSTAGQIRNWYTKIRDHTMLMHAGPLQTKKNIINNVLIILIEYNII
jgi:hypothetical protein